MNDQLRLNHSKFNKRPQKNRISRTTRSTQVSASSNTVNRTRSSRPLQHVCIIFCIIASLKSPH